MRAESLSFFRDLLAAAGPAGDEREPARVWRAYTGAFADVAADPLGSSFATANAAGTRSVVVMGHIDEIGFVVRHIDDDGYLWFAGVGGWTAAVVVGQRIRVLGRNGPVVGVVGQRAIHLIDRDDRDKAPKLDDLWIDIGAADGAAARELVRTGDMAVIEQPVIELGEGRLASRAVDNRAGAFVAAEAARLYGERPGAWRLVGCASVAEETSFTGAFTASFGLDPDAAIAVDVTHATDHPSVSKQRHGDVRLGGGPVIERGSGVHPFMFELMTAAAEAEGIPHQFAASAGSTGTDADAIKRTRAGIPAGVLSIPNRYMHSPSEIVDLADLEATAALVAATARRLDAVPDLA